MDFAFVVRQRLEELGIGQRDLANAAEVTESYISQLLGRKKLPPLPNRTDLYHKMSAVLGLPQQELARLAALEHHEALDQKWKAAPPARFGPMRKLLLDKCRPSRRAQMAAIFEKEPFGELEQLITRTLKAVVRDAAREHANDERWLRAIAKRGHDTYREMRVRMIELLESDSRVSIGDLSAFLDPLIESWDYDLDAFTLEVKRADGVVRTFGFREEIEQQPGHEEAGLRAFLRDPELNAGATAEEVEILRHMRFPSNGKPTPLFYYRVLQSLRDPLHFRAPRPRASRRS